jgi:hypothetical protein
VVRAQLAEVVVWVDVVQCEDQVDQRLAAVCQEGNPVSKVKPRLAEKRQQGDSVGWGFSKMVR